ncbi:MAG: hypothetical protein IJ599_02525, partial [Alphaproteobacteria bacterium]|nr:hypothetical protein [Alphaproteobacteria bacterium]
EFNQNKDDIIKIAVDNPAKFSDANWNALLLKTSINRMFDSVVPEEEEIDAAAEIIRKSEDYGKYWTNAQQTISDVKIYSRALRLVELIRDIKDNRHEQTFNDPEVNRACFENDPQQNEVRLTKDVSLKWNYKFGNGTMDRRDVSSTILCKALFSNPANWRDPVNFLLEANVHYDNFTLFPDNENKVEKAWFKYEMVHKAGERFSWLNLAIGSIVTDSVINAITWCSVKVWNESKGCSRYKFDLERMRFYADDTKSGFSWKLKGNALNDFDKTWLCFSDYLPIDTECIRELFNERIKLFKNLDYFRNMFDDNYFCAYHDRSHKRLLSGVVDSENIIFLILQSDWDILHSLMVDKKYMLNFHLNDDLMQRADILSGRINKHYKKGMGDYFFNTIYIKKVFETMKFDEKKYPAFSEKFFTDEYFKDMLAKSDLTNFPIKIDNVDVARDVTLSAWLCLLKKFEEWRKSGRVIVLSDDYPLDELLTKMNDDRFSFCMTKAFAMGDKSAVGFKKRLCQEVYKNIKARYDECTKR